MTKIDVDKLWRKVNDLTDPEARALLGFLFGYCPDDERFLQAVRTFLTKCLKGTQ